MSADPNQVLTALDDRLHAAILTFAKDAQRHYRRQLAALTVVVEDRRQQGETITLEWLVGQDEYIAFVRAFTAAWGDFERDALALILAGQQAAHERARDVAGAQLGRPFAEMAQATFVEQATLRAALAEVSAGVGRQIMAELLGGGA